MKAWINNREIEFTEGETILEAAKRAGIFIPTLCAYLPLDHTPGTCRMCLVQVDGMKDHPDGLIVTACTAALQEGMRIYTRSARVREMQQTQVRWLFADHDQDCSSCARHGNCELQDVALYVGIQRNPCNGRFLVKRRVDTSSPSLVLDATKCIRCGRCVEVCRKIQGLGCLTIDDIGAHCSVGISQADEWNDSPRCVNCGQCSIVCPTGAIGEKDETETAIDWFIDPGIKTVVAFAPSVRVTIGDSFGIPAGENCEKRLIAALKHMGADYVCDVNWAADVTIMEEGTELLHRLNEGGTLPMMTSCCPGWVNFAEKLHPKVLPNLSTTRSPQAIFGALAKTWFAREHGIDPKKLRFISIMPCTAKKDECSREQLAREGMPDTDLVLTVRELSRLLRRHGIRLDTMKEEEDYDSPFMSENTGAAVIFGVTGGVMEAAIRTVHAVVTGKELGPVEYQPVRGMDWLKEAEVDLGEKGKVKIAVVHGLRNAEKICRQIEEGKSPYHFIEVMACPGGCVDGGGNPRKKNSYLETQAARTEGIYRIDRNRPIRQSHNNPDVVRLYKEFLGEPCGHLSHELLHTHYKDRRSTGKVMNITEIWKEVKLG